MHIKRVELSHFKSFGGTTAVPLLPGFTVISGPNGSGKSNILDALLFALGLASSRGMRADRLPDLVNQSHIGRRSTAEATVTVTFDISDIAPDLIIDRSTPNVEADAESAIEVEATPAIEDELPPESEATAATSEDDNKVVPLPTQREWTVTRRLRVTSQGTYTSNYYINGDPCTLTELHEQLQRFRVYPEGYNVVLQGDVTSIISMNSRERREIIDELAGVASFDRKINQAMEKLEVVREREERFRMVEQELVTQRDRLAQDRLKAEKYQKLKAELHTRNEWETVLTWQQQQQQVNALRQMIQQDAEAIQQFGVQVRELEATMQTTGEELTALNARVKALGEDEHLALQSQLAIQEAELRQLQRQQQGLTTESQTTAANLRQSQINLQEQQQTLARLAEEIQVLQQGELVTLTRHLEAAQTALTAKREATSAIASASQAWVEEQTQRRRQIEDLLRTLEPQRAEQVRLQERVSQLTQQIAELSTNVQELAQQIDAQALPESAEAGDASSAEANIQRLAQIVADAEQEQKVQQETQQRLLQEQRQKQRELDKLEAQTQAMQESQGTQATQILIDSGLPGICGLVAQLGRVDPRFQLALEIAAGGRLGYLVVENDQVASQGIALLKQRRAGRATFLPLNAIRVPKINRIPDWKRPDGLVNYAVDLIDCDDRYRKVFEFVFGSTAVFETLQAARSHLGQFRMVTLDGELLETSGAMTGGSISKQRGRLHFGTVEAGESEEAIALRDRLAEIDQILNHCEQRIAAAKLAVKAAADNLLEARQQHREQALQTQQVQQQLRQLQQQRAQGEARLAQYQAELTTAQSRLAELASQLPEQEAELQAQRDALAALEQSQTHSEWQQAQTAVQTLEQQLSDRQATLQAAERRLRDFQTQQERVQITSQQQQTQIADYQQQQTQQEQQRQALAQQQTDLNTAMQATRQQLSALDAKLAEEKGNRDRVEAQYRDQQTQKQQLEWQREKRLETRKERQQQLAALDTELAAQGTELPDPLPEIPADTDLETVKKQIRSLQRRLEALEPVNMLALEEYNQTQERLEELSNKLTTLQEERTELLLRIENFTTLRQHAFQEAFDAVNENFSEIFAQLSDGDGYLQLDDPTNPFNGGLNLVAHPKGKPVRRLASMSGGEKSLTALSFIFALQRYRPSPFYAFDEVDMFLDGANVERLSKMIKQQAQQAQFIVVSLRRPMIEAAQRTIGVTQARGAYTQVLGISLEPQSASM
ncbi:chromosome segregation protein SMC [Leptolyngbya iicbica]|uniref:Chromosome partition protein Smc n=2 Tax=Cyanophyceae TaxID=3028117 RepID=A0A4Q7E696_9CYAN|nr:chromosome segregation protein SMC [Leptolyngbya sp. LK]RZM77425.1 chromosome segregation protein SMC [Leptolyngbya sp. LK]